MKRFVNYKVLSILFVIVLYSLLSQHFDNEIILPNINSIFDYLVSIQLKHLMINTSQTIIRTMISFIISLVIALFLAIIANCKNINQFINPIVSILKTIPTISVIIIALIWLGRDKSVLLIGILIVFPILYEMFYSSIKNVDHKLLEVSIVYQFDWVKKIKYIYFYHVLEQFMVTMKQTFGLGFKVMVMSEVIGQTQFGIGAQIYNEKVNLEMAGVFSWTIILIIVVLMIDGIIEVSTKKIVRWK